MISPVLQDVVSERPSYGLREGILTPSEVLAQSISAIAPSTSAALTVPLVYALAGEGTCLAYLIATLAMLLVALCINVFARDSASPGSLYVYTQRTLPPVWAAVTAWSLCFAYVVTASSVIGGFVSFACALLGTTKPLYAVLLALLVAAGAMWTAYKDIQISARLMLYVESCSVLLIGVVLSLLLYRNGLHIDLPQIDITKMHFSSIRLGVVLAIFSFVGFESATSLGAEASQPLRTIPAAVFWSTVLSGVFFVGSAYTEVLGFRGAHTGLADSPSPIRFLCARVNLPLAGPLIDIGVSVSMFAATLAFVIALGRLLLLMARHRLVPNRLAQTSERHKTPSTAAVSVGTLALLPVITLLIRGSNGAEVYGWMGSLAVFGYLTTYLLVAVAVMMHRIDQHQLRANTILLAMAAILVLLVVTLSSLFPLPPSP